MNTHVYTHIHDTHWRDYHVYRYIHFFIVHISYTYTLIGGAIWMRGGHNRRTDQPTLFLRVSEFSTDFNGAPPKNHLWWGAWPMKAIGFFTDHLLFCFPNLPFQKMLHSGKLTLAMGNPPLKNGGFPASDMLVYQRETSLVLGLPSLKLTVRTWK